MNRLFILYILLFKFIIFSQINATIPTNELNEANKILTIIGRGDNDICDALSCSTAGNDGIQHITGIYIYKPWGGDLSSIDFSKFTNLQNLDLGELVYPPINILSHLSNCLELETISISNLIEGPNVTLPSKLNTLLLNNFRGTFYANMVSLSKNLGQLSIINSVNFALSGSFAYNPSLKLFDFPLPPTGLQNLTLCFPNLVSIYISLHEVSYFGSGFVPSSYLGSIESYSTTLSSLVFSFDSNSTTSSLKKRIYLPNFRGLQLNYFSIKGDAFVLAENQSLDLTSSIPGLEISILDSINLFKNHSNCFKVPDNSNCKFSNSKIFIDQLDLRKCSQLRLNEIEPKQELLFRNINFDTLTSLDIKSSLFYGDLPESLCIVNPYSLSIKNNLFASKVPSCFICTSREIYRSSILPNNFTNFDLDTPSSCLNFSVDPISDLYLVDTENGMISITGNDLGFTVGVEGEYHDSLFTINKKIDIYTPYGTGDTNKTITVMLNDRDMNLTINYHYAPPIIYGYSVRNGYLFIYGKNFGATISNQIHLGAMEFPMLVDDSPNVFYFAIDGQSKQLEDDVTYTCTVTTDGQISNMISVLYSETQISISDSIEFTTQGVTLSIAGSFGTTDPSKVQLVIGGIICSVSQVSSTSLTFTYPKSTQNYGTDVPLFLTIDGVFYQTTVIITIVEDPYIAPPAPEWPSSSSEDSGSSSDSNSNYPSSSSEDSVSSSFKLNTSLNSMIIIIILIISITI